jgi:pimeloyl-ACP methyl ester carboxylesterase
VGHTLDNTLAVLNGAIGDWLADTANGLAIDATLIHAGRPLPIEREALVAALPDAGAKVVLLVHGLMCTEDFWRFDDGSDYGSLLARELGWTPLYLRYNTGRSIADNGATLAAMLGALLDAWPLEIDELLLLGHSMGGLVIRNACHVGAQADAAWLARVRRCIYVGTPHRGAPLERAGRLLAKVLHAVPDPYTRLAADLTNLRSTGIQDLGDPRHIVPLLPTLEHLLIAGTLARSEFLAALFGDAIVPLASATDRGGRGREPEPLPGTSVAVFPGFDHMRLARDAEVFAHVRTWLRSL